MLSLLSAVAHTLPWATACIGVAFAYPLWGPSAVRLYRHIGTVRMPERRTAYQGRHWVTRERKWKGVFRGMDTRSSSGRRAVRFA